MNISKASLAVFSGLSILRVQTVLGDVNNSRYIPCAAELNGVSDDMGFFIRIVRQLATFLFFPWLLSFE
jgi:hypothetical protein